MQVNFKKREVKIKRHIVLLGLFLFMMITFAFGSSVIDTRLSNNELDMVTSEHSNNDPGKIVFVAFQKGNWDLWVMNPDGSSTLRLTDTPIDERTPCISDDGEEILYTTSDGNLWKMDLRSRTTHRIEIHAKTVGNPVWISKKEILFVSFVFGVENQTVIDDSSLLLFNFEKEVGSNNPSVIIDQTGLQEWPSFSSTTQKLIYTSSVQGPGLELTQEIWTYDFSFQNGDQITLMNANSIQAKWSPNGMKIAFTSNKTGNYEIWVHDIVLKESKNLTDTNFSNMQPCWSPDGDEIAFVSDRTGIMEIWKMKSTGGNEEKISPFKEKTMCMYPFWGGKKADDLAN